MKRKAQPSWGKVNDKTYSFPQTEVEVSEYDLAALNDIITRYPRYVLEVWNSEMNVSVTKPFFTSLLREAIAKNEGESEADYFDRTREEAKSKFELLAKSEVVDFPALFAAKAAKASKVSKADADAVIFKIRERWEKSDKQAVFIKTYALGANCIGKPTEYVVEAYCDSIGMEYVAPISIDDCL